MGTAKVCETYQCKMSHSNNNNNNLYKPPQEDASYRYPYNNISLVEKKIGFRTFISIFLGLMDPIKPFLREEEEKLKI